MRAWADWARVRVRRQPCGMVRDGRRSARALTPVRDLVAGTKFTGKPRIQAGLGCGDPGACESGGDQARASIPGGPLGDARGGLATMDSMDGRQ